MHKVGVRCVGHQMEMHNSLVSSFLLFFKALCLKSFFKILLLFYSLESLSLDLHCPMFPLKISVLRLTLSHFL
jgi:hypothetical protein